MNDSFRNAAAETSSRLVWLFEHNGHNFSIGTEGRREEVLHGNFTCVVHWLPPETPEGLITYSGYPHTSCPVLVLQFWNGKARFTHPPGMDQRVPDGIRGSAFTDQDTFIGRPPDFVRDYLKDKVIENWASLEENMLETADAIARHRTLDPSSIMPIEDRMLHS